MSAVRSSPELVALGRDGKGEDRFTSRDMIAAEQRLERAAEGPAIDRGHGVADAHVTRALASAVGRRSEAHTSDLQSLMRNSYAVYCMTKNNSPLRITHVATTTN